MNVSHTNNTDYVSISMIGQDANCKTKQKVHQLTKDFPDKQEESMDGTVLELAAEQETDKLLIDNPNNVGETPLHVAISSQQWGAHNADPNARDNKENSPLHHLADSTDSKSDTRMHSGAATEDQEQSASKMKERLKIYSLLLREENYSSLLEELLGASTLESDDDFCGCNTELIRNVLIKMEKGESDTTKLEKLRQIVEELLGRGVDPLFYDKSCYDSAVELALANKEKKWVTQMIEQLKEKGKRYDHISFNLVRRTILITWDRKDPQKSEEETMELLIFLFGIKAITNVNEMNPRPGNKQTALHIAATYYYRQVIALLFKEGATLNKDNVDDVLEALTPEGLTEVMNHAIKFDTTDAEEDGKKVKVTATLSYGLLIPNKNSDKKKKTDARVDGQNETDIVMSICQTNHDAISHPLLWTLVMAKCRKLGWWNCVYSATIFALSLSLVITFTALAWLISNYETYPSKIIDEQRALQRTVVALCGISLLVNIVKFLVSLKLSWPLRSPTIVLALALYDIIIISLIITFCFDLHSRDSVAWIIPGAWLNSAITVGHNIEWLNTITTMLWKITLHIGKLCIFALFLVIGFSVSFSILIRPIQGTNNATSLADFSSPLLALPRVVAMATGEFNYDELRNGLLVDERAWASVSAVLLYLVFVFLVFLVIMNVMTGVAMVEAQEIKESAASTRLKRRLETVYVVEQLLWKLPNCKWLDMILPSAALFTSKKKEFKVNMETGEITYYSKKKLPDPKKLDGNMQKELRDETPPSEPDNIEKNQTDDKTTEEHSEKKTPDQKIQLKGNTKKELRNKLMKLREERMKRKEKEDRHRELKNHMQYSSSNLLVSSRLWQRTNNPRSSAKF